MTDTKASELVERLEAKRDLARLALARALRPGATTERLRSNIAADAALFEEAALALQQAEARAQSAEALLKEAGEVVKLGRRFVYLDKMGDVWAGAADALIKFDAFLSKLQSSQQSPANRV